VDRFIFRLFEIARFGLMLLIDLTLERLRGLPNRKSTKTFLFTGFLIMNLSELADHLEKNRSALSSSQVVTGFDGFVDEMITLVDERQSLDAFRRVEDISRFGDLVKLAAGHSSLREIVVTAVHPGGCAVNMGDGLASLGVQVDTFATLGDPVHAAFGEYGKLARLHSWGREPGRTLAFEFADGKLMFSSVSHLAELDAAYVRDRLQQGDFRARCNSAGLIALTDWTLYPHMTEVWKLINDSVFAHLQHKPWLFLDLVDPSSRSEPDVRAMLEAMKGFNTHTRAVLGLNQNEANILTRVLGQAAPAGSEKPMIEQQASGLRSVLGLEQVVIHGHAYAVCAHQAGTTPVDGPYCANPKKSTGAGDRFNAGYALGLLLDLDPQSCLLAAAASSGFFVRQARSACIDELVTFLRNWSADRLN
jgi:sugar/nucleoside kinase (ribokinase family)